ncbi:MAG TPA: DUF1572 family protein [Edaphobacter sp.]|nr:DUF1572 family protein [Edaphobacter sp.]
MNEYNAPPWRYTRVMTTLDTASEFLRFSRHKLLDQYWPRLRSCVDSLSDEQVWWRPNPSSNSIGNLLLHLNGNVTQWLVASFERAEDKRNRPAEFAQNEGISRTELLRQLGDTLTRGAAVLDRLAAADLLAQYEIQGYTVTGLQAVYQVVEHFALHYGQIVYITKMLRDVDLGFYSALNTTGRSSGDDGTRF